MTNQLPRELFWFDEERYEIICLNMEISKLSLNIHLLETQIRGLVNEIQRMDIGNNRVPFVLNAIKRETKKLEIIKSVLERRR